MNSETKKQLELDALKVREGVLTSTHSARSGHPGGSLSSADALTYLYDVVLNVDPGNPQWEDRDRFVLSKGHCTPGYYSALALKGFFPEEDLKTFRRIDSYLQGHPNMRLVPGVDASTGSLGQGLSIAAGMAKGAKHTGKEFDVYALLGDGELAEGQIWEALLFASHYNLDNLCILVDVNGLQIDGKTEDVMNTEPLMDKFTSFGTETIEIDGHDFEELEKAFTFFKDNKGKGKPTAIIMHTVKGKGVPFMENKASWHGTAPNDEQYAEGMAALAQARKALEGETA